MTITNERKLCGTAVCVADLDTLVTKLRELRVSHARIGDVEVWLDAVYQPSAADGEKQPEPAKASPPGEWTEVELEYVP